jgi:hypothetical protein
MRACAAASRPACTRRQRHDCCCRRRCRPCAVVPSRSECVRHRRLEWCADAGGQSVSAQRPLLTAHRPLSTMAMTTMTTKTAAARRRRAPAASGAPAARGDAAEPGTAQHGGEQRTREQGGERSRPCRPRPGPRAAVIRGAGEHAAPARILNWQCDCDRRIARTTSQSRLGSVACRTMCEVQPCG